MSCIALLTCASLRSLNLPAQSTCSSNWTKVSDLGVHEALSTLQDIVHYGLPHLGKCTASYHEVFNCLQLFLTFFFFHYTGQFTNLRKFHTRLWYNNKRAVSHNLIRKQDTQYAAEGLPLSLRRRYQCF